MEITLKQITNTLLNQENSQDKVNSLKAKNTLKKSVPLNFPFKKLIIISTTHMDFGQCLPNTIYTKIITINLRQTFSEPVGFFMQILCQDQKLNELSEFVFAIKKSHESEYTDFFRFRLQQKGSYDIVIGVKTPYLPDHHAKSQLLIYTQFSGLSNPQDFYSVKLEQKVCLPVIECTKELECTNLQKTGKISTSLRLLKFSQIKTKMKKEVRIPFKMQTDIKLNLTNELLGTMPQRATLEKNLIQVNPKQITVLGKGPFFVTFKFGFTEQITKWLEEEKKKQTQSQKVVSYTLRRILVMRVNMTNIYLHFPIEVSFLLGDKKGQISVRE